MAESLTPLIQTLHDSLMVLAPGGWTAVELKFARTSGGLRLTELETRGEGATAPKPRPELHIDPRAEAQRLSEGVTELMEHLGGRWSPGSILVKRTAELADWTLLEEDRKQAWFTRLSKDQLDALLMTDALFAMLQASEKAFHDLQLALETRLRRTTGFAFDGAAGLLSLQQADGAPLTVPVQVIGQYFTV